ncbi:hypothetical protein DKG77_01530 [Flagellimonas aquimarina]|uniref:Carboxypeptidase-like regulatory domain-containing protein n=1 Tax=Flagellimonas aquimarina TaxID=2201895 RepID=A0A316L5K1_9FLAO|nr:carboxypeptidase-like regulatory domain-containing protein [Allomuricauda koreensis]PWL39543.1 hypothetical protein DKG77_01530 [Allomuricauda koreensis]
MPFTKSLIFTLFFLFVFFAQSQEIVGSVVDKVTKKPIDGASVYFDGSSTGTITDQQGNFKIKLLYKNNATLVIRFLGYETKKIVNPEESSELKIEMRESIENLNEIVVTSDPFSRKQKLKVFKLEFLGDTKGGRNSTIVNEDEVKLFFNTYDNTLSAYCNKPLIIQNDYLGYVVNFDIEEFKIFFKKRSLERTDNIYHTVYDGSTQFYDVSSNDLKIRERREKAYLGSAMHFMRSCWDGDFKNQNFELKRGFKPVSIQKFFSKKSPNEDLQNIQFLSDKYVIYHKKKGNYRSTLSINNLDTIYTLDRYGNYSPFQEIIFGGYMANFRIGEMLPIDYGL